MQRACAYCKIPGHHIRDCEERKSSEERKRAISQPTKSQDWHTVRKAATTPKYVPPPLRKVETVKNSFANLYSSSDDELEEGEIAEESPVRHRFRVSISDSESDSARGFAGDIYEAHRSESREPTPTKWNRSCIKVVIPTQRISVSSSDEEDAPECDYVKLEEGLTFLSAYVAKFKGMNWADIESDTD